jgi:hypothetical protein
MGIEDHDDRLARQRIGSAAGLPPAVQALLRGNENS